VFSTFSLNRTVVGGQKERVFTIDIEHLVLARLPSFGLSAILCFPAILEQKASYLLRGVFCHDVPGGRKTKIAQHVSASRCVSYVGESGS